MGELAYGLSAHLELKGIGEFILLFIPIWWCWIGSTFYVTRFDNDSFADRILTFIQIAFVAKMAVNVHNGLQEAAVNFAFCYAAFRELITLQYLHAWLGTRGSSSSGLSSAGRLGSSQ